ncbi:MAG: hypothetical protein ABIJ16_12255 [Bacteroidota bacterium]
MIKLWMIGGGLGKIGINLSKTIQVLSLDEIRQKLQKMQPNHGQPDREESTSVLTRRSGRDSGPKASETMPVVIAKKPKPVPGTRGKQAAGSQQ